MLLIYTIVLSFQPGAIFLTITKILKKNRNFNFLFISFFSLTFLSFYNLQAQIKPGITGTVVESQTQEPLQYANVVLLNSVDSSMVYGTVTNLDGEFRFDNINKGKYIIKVSFIGFESDQTPIFTFQNNIYLGKIGLKKSAFLLDAVNITGEKSTLNTTLDKKVYNVSKDIISESGSVSEILQNIPSVSVDINGNVTLRGTKNINFLLNGNPSSRLRRNAPLALQQIPSNTVEKIEVITNPSAKYNPEGTGGIINIITRSESEIGFNGQVIGNVGNESKYNTSILLSYGRHDLSSFISYSLRKQSQTNIYSDLRNKKDISTGQKIGQYTENGSTYTDPLAHTVDAGIIYKLNNENNFELAGNYFSQNSLHQGNSDILEIGNSNQILDQMRTSNTNDEYEREGEGSFAFEHLFGGNEDHNLVLEATYAGYDEKEDLTFIENSVYPDYESVSKKILVKKNGNQTELVAEYALPIDSESDLEAGYSGEFIRDDIFYNTNGSESKFLFNQNINSFYALYNRDINNFSLELGLRGEQADITSHLVLPNNLITNNNYFKFYPSVLIAYEIDQTQNAKISYSKRINRPDADQLNPFSEYTDPRNAEAGNPNLKPEQTHSFELGYQKIYDSFTITPSIFYRYKYDAFTSVATLQGDSTIITTIENLSNQQSAGIEGIFSGKINKFLNFDLSASLFYNEINATNLGYSQNKGTISGLVELYSLLKLSKKTSVQFNLSYNSPVLTPQGQREAIFFVNVGYKQLLFSDQLSITFTVSDILDTYREKLNINIPELSQSTNLYRREPVFFIGASWRFGDSYQSDENQLEFESEGLRKL